MAATDAVRVSVLLPVLVGGPHVRRTLDSLLSQSLPDFELVIVDASGCAETASLLHASGCLDSRVRVTTLDADRSLSHVLNRGLENCRAELILRSCEDSLHAPNRIARQVKFMDVRPEVGLVSCACRGRDTPANAPIRPVLPVEDRLIRMRQLFASSLPGCGSAVRKHLLWTVGGYDEAFGGATELDLCARLRPLTWFANHRESLVSCGPACSAASRLDMQEDELPVFQRLLEEYLVRPVELEEVRAIVSLYRGKRRLDPHNVVVGQRGLRNILKAAKDREDRSTLKFYKRGVAHALATQSVFHDELNGRLSRALRLSALRWYPHGARIQWWVRGATAMAKTAGTIALGVDGHQEVAKAI